MDRLTQHVALQKYNANKVLRILHALNESPTGSLIYKHVAQTLEEVEQAQLKYIQGSSALIRTLLEIYCKQIPEKSLLYLELKLIQARFHPPISIEELNSLHRFIKHATALISKLEDMDTDIVRDALSPLLSDEVALRQTEASYSDSDEQYWEIPATEIPTTEIPTTEIPTNKEYLSAEQSTDDDLPIPEEQETDTDITVLQKQLNEKLKSTTVEHNKFKHSLDNFIKNFSDKNSDATLASQQNQLLEQAVKLQQSNRDLSGVLVDTNKTLGVLEQNSKKLNQELDQAKVLSLTDELTGLPNRRAFIKQLEDEIFRSQRYHTPLSLVMIDIDNFKQINDRYGHLCGDEVLRVYAKEILSVFRHYDTLARYGGEEFIVLLPSTDETGAIHAMEKVKRLASNTYYKNKNKNEKVPEFSAGIASYHEHENIEKFIHRADKAMYKAKQYGKNRIEIASVYPRSMSK